MLFILFLTIFIFILIIKNSFFLLFLLFFILSIFLLVFYYIKYLQSKKLGELKFSKKKKILLKNWFVKKENIGQYSSQFVFLCKYLQEFVFGFLMLLLAFIFSICAVKYRDYRYERPIENVDFNLDSKVCNIDNTGQDVDRCDLKGLWCYDNDRCYYIGTGKIISHDKPTRFVFEDVEGRERLLYVSDYQKSDLKVNSIYFIDARVNIVNLTPERRGEFINTISKTGESSLLPEYKFDFDKWMMMKGYYGSIFNPKFVEITYGVKKSISYLDRVRQYIVHIVTETYGNNKVSGLILGMLIGDKSFIPKEDYQIFIDSNLVHIIAVSGGNIVMLVVFLTFLLRRVPFYVRIVLLFITVVFYALICGADSSVVRATIMGGLGLLAMFVGREISVYRAMAYSRVLMILRNPYVLVYDVGFLLSFGAIIGLVWMGELSERLKVKSENGTDIVDQSFGFLKKLQKKTFFKWIGRQVSTFVKNYILPTIGASIGVFPFLIFFMKKINLTGLVANIFVLPIIPLIMVYGLFSSLVYNSFVANIFGSIIMDYMIYLGKVIVEYIYFMSEFGKSVGIFLTINSVWLQWTILVLGIFWIGKVWIKAGKK